MNARNVSPKSGINPPEIPLSLSKPIQVGKFSLYLFRGQENKEFSFIISAVIINIIAFHGIAVR